jgi:hypothetical protein
MPYDVTDLRSQLGSATGTSGAAGPTGVVWPPQFFSFPTMTPTETSAAGSVTWLVRSQNCCVAFSQMRAGDQLTRLAQPDEYVVLSTEDDAQVSVSWSGPAGTSGVGGELRSAGLIVVPPGDSTVTVHTACAVSRVFSCQSTDLLARCANAAEYAMADPNVAPYMPWPDPPTGRRVRVYAMADVPTDASRFGRIFRCSTIMVNIFEIDPAPRDPAKLSPHHHDDFEQVSLTVAGDYVHHIRTPWSVDIAHWRDDAHEFVPSPAVTIIPPPTVHTSQSVHHLPHQLIDIFCPPRRDFSAKPGWVLNADEYPMPTD